MQLVFFKGPFRGAYFWRFLYLKGLTVCTEGNLCFQIDWAILVVESKILYHFCFVFEGKFSSTSSWGGLCLKG